MSPEPQPHRPPRTQPSWTREQIRTARLVPLAPLLEQRGYKLIETGGGNFALAAFPGLIVKDAYWRWLAAPQPGEGGPERNQSGNAIDFHTQVLGLSFHDAMRALTST